MQLQTSVPAVSASKEINFIVMGKAWEYLDKAIAAEALKEWAKARMSLAMACKYELDALGFVSAASDILKTIVPWTEIRSLN